MIASFIFAAIVAIASSQEMRSKSAPGPFGPTRLTGANLMASDLRASAALIIAALAAEGQSVVHRVYHLDRGFECMEAKMASLGGRVRRLSSP